MRVETRALVCRPTTGWLLLAAAVSVPLAGVAVRCGDGNGVYCEEY